MLDLKGVSQRQQRKCRGMNCLKQWINLFHWERKTRVFRKSPAKLEKKLTW